MAGITESAPSGTIRPSAPIGSRAACRGGQENLHVHLTEIHQGQGLTASRQDLTRPREPVQDAAHHRRSRVGIVDLALQPLHLGTDGRDAWVCVTRRCSPRSVPLRLCPALCR